MIDKLTILIPVYNDDASSLVQALVTEARNVKGLDYEIIVFDDGSTDARCIDANHRLALLPGCNYVSAPHHPCRASMRNAMLRQGRYEWCLMIDARLRPANPDFISRYVHAGADGCGAVCGGVVVDGGKNAKKLYRENLRFRYEKHAESLHSVAIRQQHPYQSFRTTNILLRRSVLQHTPYDERIIGYGYEDVMLGRDLEHAGIKVLHIDNPVAYTSFEDNDRYLAKTEEAMHTLRQNSDKLGMYSPILNAVSKLTALHLLWLIRTWHRIFGHIERSTLCGANPQLAVFKLYKLGYYASLP